MEFDLPDRSSVHVGERVGDGGAHEVPQLDASITARCDQVRASGVEVDGRDPVAVTLTSHDVLARLHVPNLPCAVIRGCGNDLLSLMESHTTDTSCMSSNLVGCGQSGWDRLIGLGEEWIWSGILGHARILGGSFAQCALAKEL